MNDTSEWTREFARASIQNSLNQVISQATPGLNGRVPNTADEFSELLTVTHLVSQQSETILRNTVVAAHLRGMSWEEIGIALGVSPAMAQQTYGSSSGSAVLPITTHSVPPVGTRASLSAAADSNIQMLNRAGQYGWRAVAFSVTQNWTVEFDNCQWQYETTSGKKVPNGYGWEKIAKFGFVYYWGRPTSLPILPGNPEMSAFRSEKQLQVALTKTTPFSVSLQRGLTQLADYLSN